MNNYYNGRGGNNNNTWKNNDHSKGGGGGKGGGGRKGGGGGRGTRRTGQGHIQNFPRSDDLSNEGGERNFKKFVDIERNNNNSNDINYWPQNEWNYNNNRNNSYGNNHYSNNGGIIPWHRKKPIPLIIPPQQQNNDAIENEQVANDKEVNVQNNVEYAEKPCMETTFTPQKILNENENSNSTNTNKTVSGITETSENTVAPTFTVNIKQEKQNLIKLKQEKKSSSSSSSSSESSSSDEEPEPPKEPAATKPAAVKPPASNTKEPCSPLNIKLKPKQNSAIIPPITSVSKLKIENKITPPSSSSSSSISSSSSDEEEQTSLAPPPPKPTKTLNKTILKPIKKRATEAKSAKKRSCSEDDVVCIGNMENKIVLEDESDNEDSEDESSKTKKSNKKNKKSLKKAIEKCMICEKKGHTSFQCQMICKNCSAPHHGFRTCPQPANLNIMLQLFMEFCMQQLQHYNSETQFTTNQMNSVPKPLVSSPSTKPIKHKRKQSKTSESIVKSKPAKKRKLTNLKKKIFEEDDDSESSSQESEEDTTNSDKSSSSFESLVSSKKKLKQKNRNASMAAFNLSNFTSNPVNLPLVLNSFPNLAASSTPVANPNTSSNALNTLLLTQMFQNAIGSLK